jgi:hypothetical protein
LLRDTDGFALTMVPLAQLEAITEIAQVAVAALLALAAAPLKNRHSCAGFHPGAGHP